jgi:leucyl-tRNA synthetase
MPNWAGSSWYFLRYCDAENNRKLADGSKLKYWQPVDVYVGGSEHTTLHLLYSRFWHKFLNDIGVVPGKEPYYKRVEHGVILGPDGKRMSKSRGNVIVPDDVAKKYGVDTLRTYLAFMGPLDATIAWDEKTLKGVQRFLDRFYRFVMEQIRREPDSIQNREAVMRKGQEVSAEVVVHRLIKKVGDDLAKFKFNTAVATIMSALNGLAGEVVGAELLQDLVLVVAPIVPYLAEELWEALGGEFSVHSQSWPVYDKKLLDSMKVEIGVQVNGKVRGSIQISPLADESEAVEIALQVSNVRKYVVKKPKKVIYVQGKILNLIVDS